MKQNNMPISSQTNNQAAAKADMPRERLLKYGAKALADYELLAILLKTGLAGKSVLTLAQDILTARGGLVGLLVSDYEHLIRIKGLGNAKIAEILAITEIARRFVESELTKPEWVFSTSDQVREFLLMHFKGLAEEQFGMLLLDQKHRFIAFELVVRGEVTSVSIPIRRLIADALKHQCAAIVLVHNHPAHSVEPSAADIEATNKIERALAFIEVRLLDHFIVSGNQIVSMKEEGGWK